MVKKEEKEKKEKEETEDGSETIHELSITHPKEEVQKEASEKEKKEDLIELEEEKREIEEKVIQIDRVTRVVKGGRRLRFRATVVVGDKNGKVGVAVAKGTEVLIAINKATAKAKKELTSINLKETTIPHEVTVDFGGAKVLLKPASAGTGLIAGSAVRAVLEVCGISDILSKALGSNNKINNVYATFLALKKLRKF